MHTHTPVPPCHSKCCKVRFKPTIEVREMRGRSIGNGRLIGTGTSIYNAYSPHNTGAGSFAPRCYRYHNANEVHLKKLPIPLLPVGKVFLLSVIFGVLVSE